MVVIINPESGVGSSKDANYSDGIKKLKAVGIIVLGYVWTDYGFRSPYWVKPEINKYKN